MDEKLFKLIDQHTPKMRPENYGITVAEYSKKKGCSPHYARKVLRELEDAGLLKSERMISGKSTGLVYYEAKQK